MAETFASMEKTDSAQLAYKKVLRYDDLDSIEANLKHEACRELAYIAYAEKKYKQALSYSEDSRKKYWYKHFCGNAYEQNDISTRTFESSCYLAMDEKTEFIKWEAVAIHEVGVVQQSMKMELLIGNNAVFKHKGKPEAFRKTFDYIFNEWLPKSGYALDDQAHFEKVPEGNEPMSDESTEEIWIPIKKIP